MVLSLLQTHTITFYRPQAETLQPDGTYSSAGPDQAITPDTVGNLQPIDEGTLAKIFPRGIETDSSYFFYTDSSLVALNTHSEFQDTQADYCIIDGRPHDVYSRANWQGYGLSIEHKEYILIGRSLNAEGGIL